MLDTPGLTRQALPVTTWDDDASLHRSGEGEPLVLLHGVTSSWHCWKPVIPALAEKYDVIALNLPGHLGWAWPAGREHSIASMAALIVDRLHELGVERPHVAGNSLGGWIALEMIAHGQARSVTAFSPAGGWEGSHDVGPIFLPTQQKIAGMRSAAEQVMAEPERRKRLLSIYLENADRMPAEEAVRGWDAVLAVESLADMLQSFTTPVRSPVPADAPVSIVWGSLEKLLPEFFGAPGWKQAAPGAVWSHLETGHMPMYDDPEGVVRAIEETTARA